MPMDFPDIVSLINAAKVHNFRSKIFNETEDEYRKVLALHVRPIDRIESFEIEFGVGWDKWNSAQKLTSTIGGVKG